MACNKNVQELAGEIETTSLTEETSIDRLADIVPFYDDSESALRKAVLSNIFKPRGALVYLSANQSIPNSSSTAINFDAETYDTDSIHDNVTNNSRLTVPTGWSWVRLNFCTEVEANVGGVRAIGITKNGSAAIAGTPHVIEAANNGSISARLAGTTAILGVTAGDYFQVSLFQNSGGALNALSANNRTWFSMELIA